MPKSVSSRRPQSFRALFWVTLRYSLVLAVIFSFTHIATQFTLVSLLMGTLDSIGLRPGDLLGSFFMKAIYSVIICEALVFASILARRRWLVLPITAVVVTTAAAVVSTYLGRHTAGLFLSRPFDLQQTVQTALIRGGKYSFLGVGLVGVQRLANPKLYHYTGAGIGAAIVNIIITFKFNLASTPINLSMVLPFDIIFPIGCALVVWKVTNLTSQLKRTHHEARTLLKNR
ncbi:MAG: hypothetical protein ABSD41_11990 [Candidatus Bathyarchaeia archaeon]|jgi:hypothetical protein